MAIALRITLLDRRSSLVRRSLAHFALRQEGRAAPRFRGGVATAGARCVAGTKSSLVYSELRTHVLVGALPNYPSHGFYGLLSLETRPLPVLSWDLTGMAEVLITMSEKGVRLTFGIEDATVITIDVL